jgi:hypothetical protein
MEEFARRGHQAQKAVDNLGAGASTHHWQKETMMFRAASRMPLLPHFPCDGSPFDINKSEAVKWLCSQEAIKQTIFNMAKRHGMIEFDLEKRCWRGVNWSGKP